jgi:hypothetical protein
VVAHVRAEPVTADVSTLSCWDPRARDADAPPCRCHRSHAYISPIHDGHCCCIPETQTCHPVEMAAWIAEHQRLNPGWRPS